MLRSQNDYAALSDTCLYPSSSSINGPATFARRTCFICLEGGDLRLDGQTKSEQYSSSSASKEQPRTKKNETKLVPCCSQCFTVVHRKCWKEWRKTQKFAMLRAKLLAQNQPDILSCTVCKTGIAGLFDERTQTFETLATKKTSATDYCLREHIQNELFQVIGRMLTDGLEDSEDEEPYCCSTSFAIFNTVVVFALFMLDTILIYAYRLYAGDVVLWTLYSTFIFALVELLFLAIHQRKRSLGPLLERPTLMAHEAEQMHRVSANSADEERPTLNISLDLGLTSPRPCAFIATGSTTTQGLPHV